jgi:hypothetical protein
MTGVLLLIVAAGILAASALAWTGRWRSWSRRVLTGPLPMPITLLPGLGLALVASGLYELGAPMAVAAPFFVAFLLSFVVYLWAPDWWGPRWLKEEREEGIQPDVGDPLTALSYSALTRTPDAARSTSAVAERFGAAQPLERWNATWIEHEEGGEKVHALARPGATQGKLELYENGLAFRAIGLEDSLRGEATAVAVDRSEFGAARVVPAGAGPDGRKRPRAGARSAFKRLVVDTQFGPFLFEVQAARRKAQRITQTLGQPR